MAKHPCSVLSSVALELLVVNRRQADYSRLVGCIRVQRAGKNQPVAGTLSPTRKLRRSYSRPVIFYYSARWRSGSSGGYAVSALWADKSGGREGLRTLRASVGGRDFRHSVSSADCEYGKALPCPAAGRDNFCRQQRAGSSGKADSRAGVQCAVPIVRGNHVQSGRVSDVRRSRRPDCQSQRSDRRDVSHCANGVPIPRKRDTKRSRPSASAHSCQIALELGRMWGIAVLADGAWRCRLGVDCPPAGYGLPAGVFWPAFVSANTIQWRVVVAGVGRTGPLSRVAETSRWQRGRVSPIGNALEMGRAYHSAAQTASYGMADMGCV